MGDYTPNQIVDILLILGECHGNYRRAALLYGQRFQDDQNINQQTIRRLEARARRGYLRRQRPRRNIENVNNNPRFLATVAMVHIDPHISLREIERDLGIPRSTASRYLRLAKYHPYHISLNQALSDQDHVKRVRFCQWARNQIQIDPHFFRFVMFSDEATFNSIGHLNRHNSHYWSPVNPHWMQQIDHQHRWSVNVWCGILNGHLIGPYFFDGTVDSARYVDMLKNHLPMLLENIDLYTRNRMWLQQDGATPHWAVVTRNFLNQRFPNRWIGRDGPIEWPARSPDLTSPDFYLWGYLKETVYRERPRNIEDMRARIRLACAHIPQEVLLRSVNEFERRVEACLFVGGATFEHLPRQLGRAHEYPLDVG